MSELPEPGQVQLRASARWRASLQRPAPAQARPPGALAPQQEHLQRELGQNVLQEPGLEL